MAFDSTVDEVSAVVAVFKGINTTRVHFCALVLDFIVVFWFGGVFFRVVFIFFLLILLVIIFFVFLLVIPAISVFVEGVALFTFTSFFARGWPVKRVAAVFAVAGGLF